MLARLMAPLTLEIVEGPGAGRQLVVDRAAVIGRAADSDFMLEDNQASRRHARVKPGADGALVIEDLGSANGTFINHNELHGPARLDPGDELLVGVTLMEVRTSAQVADRQSAVRPVPAALAMAPTPPHYVNPQQVEAPGVKEPLSPELDRYLDVKVRRRAQLAPLALAMLIALALCIYFATR
jgi:pSer/pThr/pTyr-binding forkhead associated (FHA) protein